MVTQVDVVEKNYFYLRWMAKLMFSSVLVCLSISNITVKQMNVFMECLA